MHRSWNMTCESFLLVSNQFKILNEDWIALTDHRTATDFLCLLEHKENLSKHFKIPSFFSMKKVIQVLSNLSASKCDYRMMIFVFLSPEKKNKIKYLRQGPLVESTQPIYLGWKIEDMNSCFLRIWTKWSEFMLKTRTNICQRRMKMLWLLTKPHSMR